MHELLSLAKEVDLDIMSDTMRKLVDDFSAELIPYTEDLSVQVCQSYLRIMQESLDARDVNGEDDGAAETKAMAGALAVHLFPLQANDSYFSPWNTQDNARLAGGRAFEPRDCRQT